ncbi:hypothetical protein PPROV_000441200 [Pycnococcus provasolii]|uniref:Uncharacterized protein n=1 Tax=Pycnococcus provasolii TaxID=41880 RepID=A0A830HFZ0_9CHLO|nr:hypothetical protein PPROV_000441200 [Pycnococcus provasolii]
MVMPTMTTTMAVQVKTPLGRRTCPVKKNSFSFSTRTFTSTMSRSSLLPVKASKLRQAQSSSSSSSSSSFPSHHVVAASLVPGCFLTCILTFGSPSFALAAAAANSNVPGTYLDPSHPGCTRTIDSTTGRITGKDLLTPDGLIGPPGTACEGRKQSELREWSVDGKLVGQDTILIDFDAVDAVKSGKRTKGVCLAVPDCEELKLPNGVWTKVK